MLTNFKNERSAYRSLILRAGVTHHSPHLGPKIMGVLAIVFLFRWMWARSLFFPASETEIVSEPHRSARLERSPKTISFLRYFYSMTLFPPSRAITTEIKKNTYNTIPIGRIGLTPCLFTSSFVFLAHANSSSIFAYISLFTLGKLSFCQD